MTVKLPAGVWTLLSLILTGVLASDWLVDVPTDPVYAHVGSSVLLHCSFDYPEQSEQGTPHKVLSEMWCLNESRCITPRYVYHSAGISPEPAYEGRITYFGRTGSRNCSLMISDLRSEDSGLYVFRFITDHPKAKLPKQRGVRLEVTQDIHSIRATSSTVGVVLGFVISIIIAAILITIIHKAWNKRQREL